LVSLHHLQASIFPSMPRLPKPPGTTTPLRAETVTDLITNYFESNSQMTDYIHHLNQ